MFFVFVFFHWSQRVNRLSLKSWVNFPCFHLASHYEKTNYLSNGCYIWHIRKPIQKEYVFIFSISSFHNSPPLPPSTLSYLDLNMSSLTVVKLTRAFINNIQVIDVPMLLIQFLRLSLHRQFFSVHIQLWVILFFSLTRFLQALWSQILYLSLCISFSFFFSFFLQKK